MKHHRYTVIMAGGKGTRFWPLSRSQRFAIPAGQKRRLTVRLDERHYETLRRRDDGTLVSVEARIDGHRVRPNGPDMLVLP